MDNIIQAVTQLEAYTIDCLDVELVEIQYIMQKCITIHKKAAVAAKIALHTHISEGIPPILGDRLRLQQVLISVIYHALSFTPPQGEVDINIYVEKESNNVPKFLVINIQDTGLGLDEEKRLDLVKTFQQTKSGGLTFSADVMRLSFSIIKHIIRLHHGTFTMDAVYTKGTTVTIRLPYLNNSSETSHNNSEINVEDKNKTPSFDKKYNIISFPTKYLKNI